MPRNKLNFDTVREVAATFPGVTESTAYGFPALKLKGELLACIPANRSAEPDSLLVRVGFEDRAELLAEDPAVFYVTDHYLNYTSVLVRLTRIDRGKLRDLLGMSYKFLARQAKPSSTTKRR